MKRILTVFLVVLMVFGAILPAAAFAAEPETAIGYSDSGPGPEDTPEATPTDTPEPEAGPAEAPPEDGGTEAPEEAPGDIPAEPGEETPGAPCDIAPFSGFVGEDNEYYTKIRLTATDRDGNPLSGAVYGLYRSNGELVEYLTTNYAGVATSSDVPVDTDYYLEEITPPTGFAPNTERRDIILSEVCAPSRIDVSVEYDPITGRIEVIKTDESGNPLPGAGFYVYRESTGQLVDTILTGEDGRAATVELPYGRYELYEYLVPEGYDGGGYYMAGIEYEGETAAVYVVNQLSRAYVRVYKTGEDERRIQGAVFSLYTASGEWVEDIATNSGGYAYSSALALGGYYLIEKSVPEGYRIDDAPHSFTLSYSWQTVYIDLVNQRAGNPGRLKIIKTDERENPLSGVTFGLYRAWDDKKLAELTTGEDGTAESDLLIPQDYYLVELTGKPGYESNTGQIAFTVNQNGGEVVVVVVNPKERVFGKVRVIKQDDTGNLLPGARFGLYCGAGNLLQEMTTGENGTATSGVLNAGDYYLVELAGIPGYVADTQQHPVTIAENNVTVPVTVINPRITGSVKVIKTGDSGEPLSGVVFGIFKDGQQLETLTTGEDGTAASGALYYGGYELRELSTVAGYELLTVSIPFSILTDGAVIPIPVTNPLIYGGVRVFKTDGGEQAARAGGNPLPGAVFGVYNGQGQLIAELTSGEDGIAEMGGLVMGDYFLREHTAPEGFMPIEDDIPFSITAQGEVIEITVPNIAGSGTLRVLKTGEDEKPLVGVVFEVYRASDDEKITEITTDENGAAEAPLPLGAYYLLETRTAEHYKLPDGGFSFALTEHGAVLTLPIQNQKEPPAPPATGKIQLIKKAEGTGALLTGAVFGMYDAANTKVAELTTGADGTATTGDLPAGDYYLIEQKAPAGFILSAVKTAAAVKAGETITVTVTNAPVKPTNPDPSPPAPGTVKIIKKAEDTGKRLSGAVFGVYRASDDKKVAEITTGKNGTADYNLDAGRYYLLERTAPEGFKRSADKISFTVRAGETKEITVTNTPKDKDEPDTGSLHLVKKAEGTGARLAGAVFGVYRASDNKKLMEITTDSDGEALCALEPGSFYLRELKAPSGYLLESVSIPFTVRVDSTVRVEVTNLREQSAGSVKLTKRGPDGEAVSGAVFGIYQASGNTKVAEITSGTDGTALYALAPGAYYLQEQSVPAPYVRSTGQHKFTVTSGQTVEVRVVNQRTAPAPAPDGIETIPKTGEAFPYGTYALAALFMALALSCGIMLYRERGRKNQVN